MHFERIKTPGIAHVAYVLADEETAAIVDPGRDVERYTDHLRKQGLTLRWILETHRQEDFEMGGATLRRLMGAEIIACDHEITAHADKRLADGDELDLSESLRLKALHTPGHTPESMTYAIMLAKADGKPWGVFTGDALFIGDTGRTDLVDAEKAAENAGLLYDQVHEKILPLGEQALVLPAHGAGSACGGNVADRDHSTIGIEQATNAVAQMSRDEFVRHKAEEGMARPPYFRLMEEVNLEAGRPFEDTPVPWLSPDDFERESDQGIIIDTRDVGAYAGGHVPGAYSVWLSGMARYGGWVASNGTPVYLVVDDPAALREARLSLARIGYDKVEGALAGGFEPWRDSGKPIEMTGTISARQLRERMNEFTVLDVREKGEYEQEGHIPNARHVFVGHLEDELDSMNLDKTQPIASTCTVGHRGSLGASILRRNGFSKAFNLLGGMTAWQNLELPMEGL